MPEYKRQLGELEKTEMESGVSAFTGEPFCAIRVSGTLRGKPVLLRGQLSPEELRQHALRYVEVAEAAESDAAIRAVFVKLGWPTETWANFILLLREQRLSSSTSTPESPEPPDPPNPPGPPNPGPSNA